MFRINVIIQISILCIVFISGTLFAQGAGNALNFDGVDDYADITYDTGLPIYDDGSGAYTVEFWVKGPSGQDQEVIFSESNSGSINPDDAYPLFLISTGATASGSDDNLDIYIRSSTPSILINHEISTSVVFDNTWHHIAWIDDNGITSLYVDGVLDNTSFTDYTRETIDLDVTTLGALNRPGLNNQQDFFEGAVDEVRLWNTARTQAQIRENMNKTLSGVQSNLVAYWPSNEESGITLTDAENSNNGNLIDNDTGNGDGNTPPTFVNSTAPVGESSAFVNSTTPTSVGPAGGEIEVTITSIPDASNYLMVYQFGSVSGPPVSAGESFPTGFDRRSDIVWGVNEIGSVTATLVFDYSNVQGIVDPSTIEILRRDDADDTTWEEVTESSRNDGNRTITLTGYSAFSEFALGGNNTDNPLPIELASFTAIGREDGVMLKWETVSEIENQGFEIYRSFSEDGAFDLIADFGSNPELKSRGSSSAGSQYLFTDKSVMPGQTYYYKLADIDYNGQRTEHGPVMALFSEANLEQLTNAQMSTRFEISQNYPNPFNPSTTIEFILPENIFDEPQVVNLSIYNLQGQLVKNLLTSSLGSGHYKATWNGTGNSGQVVPSGVYIYHLRVPALGMSQSKRMMLLK